MSETPLPTPPTLEVLGVSLHLGRTGRGETRGVLCGRRGSVSVRLPWEVWWYQVSDQGVGHLRFDERTDRLEFWGISHPTRRRRTASY